MQLCRGSLPRQSTSIMTKIGLCFLAIASALFVSCQSSDGTARYLSPAQRDTLLLNIVTYTSQYARGADNATRFEPRFRAEYASRLKQYQLENYEVTPDSTHYFFIVRPVGGGYYKRGVGGKFTLKNGSLMPQNYEELWCSPHFKSDSVIKARGNYVFSEMVKKGNVDHLLQMKHYIEWPDSMLVYDKKRHEWVATEKMRF